MARRGRIGPGGMVAVDTVAGTFRETEAIRASLARQRPYGRLLARAVVSLDADTILEDSPAFEGRLESTS